MAGATQITVARLRSEQSVFRGGVAILLGFLSWETAEGRRFRPSRADFRDALLCAPGEEPVRFGGATSERQ